MLQQHHHHRRRHLIHNDNKHHHHAATTSSTLLLLLVDRGSRRSGCPAGRPAYGGGRARLRRREPTVSCYLPVVLLLLLLFVVVVVVSLLCFCLFFGQLTLLCVCVCVALFVLLCSFTAVLSVVVKKLPWRSQSAFVCCVSCMYLCLLLSVVGHMICLLPCCAYTDIRWWCPFMLCCRCCISYPRQNPCVTFKLCLVYRVVY